MVEFFHWLWAGLATLVFLTVVTVVGHEKAGFSEELHVRVWCATLSAITIQTAHHCMIKEMS